MKKYLTFPILLGVCLAPSVASTPAAPATHITPALTTAQNEFAVDLYRQLRHSPANFFFAPTASLPLWAWCMRAPRLAEPPK